MNKADKMFEELGWTPEIYSTNEPAKVMDISRPTLWFSFTDREGKLVDVSLDEIRRVLNQLAEIYGIDQI